MKKITTKLIALTFLFSIGLASAEYLPSWLGGKPVETITSWAQPLTTVTLKQTGDKVSGHYRWKGSDQAYIKGVMEGNVLTGYWYHPVTNYNTCAKHEEFNTTHWGRLKIVFDGDSYTIQSGPCNKHLDWSQIGKRIYFK